MKTLKRSVFFLAMVAVCFGQNESLLIGRGDELRVEVFDTPEMHQTLRVTDAGEIPLMFIGNVKVAGLTPGDASRVIEDTLKAKQFMVHPQVAVTVEEYAASQQLSITGQVRNPGNFTITSPVSLINVISTAGGLTDLADRNITIQRHGDPANTVKYFLSNNSDAAIRNDLMVNPGDLVIVPKAGVVYVLGDVLRPGGYPLTDNESQITVLQALAQAGSPNRTASVSKAKLVRKTPTGTSEVPIKLSEMEKGKVPDMAMLPNDVLYVPFSFMRNIATNGSQIAAAAASAIIYTH